MVVGHGLIVNDCGPMVVGRGSHDPMVVVLVLGSRCDVPRSSTIQLQVDLAGGWW